MHFLFFAATLPLRNRAQAWLDLRDQRPRDLQGQARQGWLRPRGSNINLGHHFQSQQSDHQAHEGFLNRSRFGFEVIPLQFVLYTSIMLTWKFIGFDLTPAEIGYHCRQYSMLHAAKSWKRKQGSCHLWAEAKSGTMRPTIGKMKSCLYHPCHRRTSGAVTWSGSSMTYL